MVPSMSPLLVWRMMWMSDTGVVDSAAGLVSGNAASAMAPRIRRNEERFIGNGETTCPARRLSIAERRSCAAGFRGFRRSGSSENPEGRLGGKHRSRGGERHGDYGTKY